MCCRGGRMTKTRCCILGVALSHVLLITALALCICVGYLVYADYQYMDMPTDMRLFKYPHNALFCEEYVINAFQDDPNTNGSATKANFDAYMVKAHNISDLKMKKKSSKLEGSTVLTDSLPYNYYTFHWMASSSISFHISIPDDAMEEIWAYVVIGDSKFHSMLKTIKKGQNVTCDVPTECLAAKHILAGSGGNFKVTINETNDYYLVLYRHGNNTKTASQPNNVLHFDQREQENNLISDNSPPQEKVEKYESKSVPVMYTIKLDLMVYDLSNEDLTERQAVEQSDFKTDDVYDYFILDFHYFDVASNDDDDYLSIVVNVACHGRAIAYIGVFGLTAVALIILVIVMTLVIISKCFNSDVLQMGDSGLFRGDGDGYETF